MSVSGICTASCMPDQVQQRRKANLAMQYLIPMAPRLCSVGRVLCNECSSVDSGNVTSVVAWRRMAGSFPAALRGELHAYLGSKRASGGRGSCLIFSMYL
jgi:hypothetical protein